MLPDIINYEDKITLIMGSGIQFLDFALKLDLRRKSPVNSRASAVICPSRDCNMTNVATSISIRPNKASRWRPHSACRLISQWRC